MRRQQQSKAGFATGPFRPVQFHGVTPDEPWCILCGMHHEERAITAITTTPPQRRFTSPGGLSNFGQNLNAGKLRLSIVSVKYQTQYIVPFSKMHALSGKLRVSSILGFNTLS